jgi:hypothetical protein
MKVKTENITELLNQVAWYMDGIQEACRMGGDILPNIDGQAGEVKKILVNFRATHLAPAETENIPDGKHSYLKVMGRILAENKTELTSDENASVVMAKLYAWLKRTIREQKDMPGPGAKREEIFQYVDSLLCSWEMYRHHEKGFYYSMMKVLDDVVCEIMEHRNNTPQQKLF